MNVRFDIPDVAFRLGLKVGTLLGRFKRGYTSGLNFAIGPESKFWAVRVGRIVGVLVAGVKNGFQIAKGGTA